MNSPERDRRLIKLLDIALELDPEQLNDFLGAVEPSLRTDLEALVAASKNTSTLDALGAHLMSLLDSSRQAKEMPRLVPGQDFAGYQIDKLIGKGGMGEVYKARDFELDRDVVIKLPLLPVAQDGNYRQRFQEEAKILAKVNHSNVVVIHKTGEADGILYIVTECVDGETLRDHISKKRMTLEAAMAVAIQVASGLEAAHDRGVIHRDIKPENIMLQERNHVKILDFGLAKRAASEAIAIDTQANTLTGMITKPSLQMGTPMYMSPEQWNGDTLDARTDIFSFGIVLYEMVTGRLPFDASGQLEIKQAVLHAEPLPLDRDIPELSALLRWIINKSLRKNRDRRYQTVRELRVDLEEEVRGQLNRDLTPAQSLMNPVDEQAQIDSAIPGEAVTLHSQPTYDAFISYSHEDAEWVTNSLVPRLRQDGISICSDDSFPIGEPVLINIENAVASSRSTVLVITPAWIKSPWTSHEHLLTQHQGIAGLKRVLPLLLKPVEKMPPALDMLTRADLVSGKDTEKEFAKLSLAIRALRRLPVDEPLPKPYPPIPLLAASEITRASAAWPFDLGTIWGLERGRFVGILACSQAAQPYQNLVNVEGCLFESILRPQSVSVLLPRRIWKRVSPHERPDDLWQHEAPSTTPNGSGIDKKDESRSDTILGFFLEIDAAEFNRTPWLKAAVHDWCKALKGETFLKGQDAVVIAVTSEQLSEAREVSEQVYQQLETSTGTTIDLLTLPPSIVTDHILEYSVSSQFDAFDAMSNQKPGSYLWAWLLDAAGNPLLQSEEARNKYTKLIDLYHSLPGKQTANGERIPAFRVVADLDGISSWSGELDRQFLNLVKTYLPGRALELVRAYSGSKRSSARREALIFSVADDLFLDAWVEGAGFRKELLQDGNVLSADVREPRLLADALALSLMRRSRSSNRAETIAALNDLRSRGGLGASAMTVCELFLGEVTQESFINTQREDAYLMAIRASFSFDPRLSALTYLNIDNYEVWRLLTAIPPNRERVNELLNMAKGTRAIFGLCTAEEWEEIARDRPLMDKILRCRQTIIRPYSSTPKGVLDAC